MLRPVTTFRRELSWALLFARAPCLWTTSPPPRSPPHKSAPSVTCTLVSATTPAAASAAAALSLSRAAPAASPVPGVARASKNPFRHPERATLPPLPPPPPPPPSPPPPPPPSRSTRPPETVLLDEVWRSSPSWNPLACAVPVARPSACRSSLSVCRSLSLPRCGAGVRRQASGVCACATPSCVLSGLSLARSSSLLHLCSCANNFSRPAMFQHTRAHTHTRARAHTRVCVCVCVCVCVSLLLR